MLWRPPSIYGRFRLFKTVDYNQSGLIDFFEYETIVRELLQLIRAEPEPIQ